MPRRRPQPPQVEVRVPPGEGGNPPSGKADARLSQPVEPRTDRLPAVPRRPDTDEAGRPGNRQASNVFRPTSVPPRSPEASPEDTKYGRGTVADDAYGGEEHPASGMGVAERLAPAEDDAQDQLRDDHFGAEEDDAREDGIGSVEDEADVGYDEPDNGREWLTLVGLIAAGVVGGAAVWLGFDWLWGVLPAAAVVAAAAVIVAMVWIVRRIRRGSGPDTQTTVLAVLVGLVVTVSPAALLLLSR